MRIGAIAQRIETWLILGLIALLPFFVVPLEWFTVPQSKMLLLSIVAFLAVVVYAVGAYFRDEVIVPRNLLFYALASVPLSYLISALFTGWSSASLVAGMGQNDTVYAMLTSFVVLYLAVSIFARSSQLVVVGLRTLAVGSLILLFLELLHVIVPGFSFGGVAQGITFNFVGSPHDLGIFAAFSLFLFAMYARTPVFGSLLWRSLAIIGALGYFVILFLLEMPDLWFACAFLAALFAVYLWRLTPRDERVGTQPFVVAWGAAALVFVTLAFLTSNVSSALPSSLRVAQLEARPSWQSTFVIGRSALGNPKTFFFGTGPSSFARDWELYKPASINSTALWNAQFDTGVGSVPTSFVTVGLLGLLAWLFVLVALAVALWRAFMMPPGRAALARTPLVMLAAFLFVFHILYAPSAALAIMLWLTTALLIALAVSSGGAKVIRLHEPTWQGITASLALLVGVAVMLYIGVGSLRAILSDAYVNEAMSALAAGNASGASSYVTEAIALSSSNDRAQREAVTIGLSELSGLLGTKSTSTEATAKLQKALDATISHGLAAVAIDSSDNQNWLALAGVYAQLAGAHVSGADKSAQQAYERAAAAAPTDPLPHMQLAQLDILSGSTSTARTELQKAIALKPDISLAHYLLSQIDASSGDMKDAQSEALRAVDLAPQDPTVAYNLGAILYSEKDYTNALPVLKRTVALQNNYANALLLLALTYDDLGQQTNALGSLQALQQLDPTNAAVSTMIANVQAGKSALATSTPTTTPTKKKK